MTIVRVFPQDLARVVTRRWHRLVAGEYEPPPCPSEERLQELLEVSYLVASAPEEDRYPQFNLIAVPANEKSHRDRLDRALPFDHSRDFSVSELRRLAPAVNIETSAILVEWTESDWRIAGLVSVGSSWYRARLGLEYRYKHPHCLLVYVERPGRMKIYQGGFRVATLMDGDIDNDSVDLQTWIHPVVREGLSAMKQEVLPPTTNNFADFQFMALLNVFGSIANSISLSGHGGTVVIAMPTESLSESIFRVKYSTDSSILRAAFVSFINACHGSADLDERRERGEFVELEDLTIAELQVRDTFSELVEVSSFISRLAGCDGAIVLTADVRLLGFGCEIRAEFLDGTEVLEVFCETDAINGKGSPLDVEQFGMRHRSAVKLVSRGQQYYALVISQDGPVSAVWPDFLNPLRPGTRRMFVRKGVNFVNANMPWS